MLSRTKGFIKRRGQGAKTMFSKTMGLDEIKENKNTIVGALRALAKPRVAEREETFRNAYKRLNLNEVELEKAHRFNMFRFYLFSLFTAGSLSLFVYSVMDLNALTAASCLGALALFSALSFQASFRLYQINRRELVGVPAFIADPKFWIPAPFQHSASYEKSVQDRREKSGGHRKLRKRGRKK